MDNKVEQEILATARAKQERKRQRRLRNKEAAPHCGKITTPQYVFKHTGEAENRSRIDDLPETRTLLQGPGDLAAFPCAGCSGTRMEHSQCPRKS